MVLEDILQNLAYIAAAIAVVGVVFKAGMILQELKELGKKVDSEERRISEIEKDLSFVMGNVLGTQARKRRKNAD